MKALSIICFLLTFCFIGITRGLASVSYLYALFSIILALVSFYFAFHFKGKSMLSESKKYFNNNPDVGMFRANHYATSTKDRAGVIVIEGSPLHQLDLCSAYCIKEGNYKMKVTNPKKDTIDNIVSFTVERCKVYDLKFDKAIKSYYVVESEPKELRSYIDIIKYVNN